MITFHTLMFKIIEFSLTYLGPENLQASFTLSSSVIVESRKNWFCSFLYHAVAMSHICYGTSLYFLFVSHFYIIHKRSLYFCTLPSPVSHMSVSSSVFCICITFLYQAAVSYIFRGLDLYSRRDAPSGKSNSGGTMMGTSLANNNLHHP